MSSYEESMRAKFRGEDVYADKNSILESEECEAYDEPKDCDQADISETEDNELNDADKQYDNEYASKVSVNLHNKTWSDLDINKVSEMKDFMTSDGMFNLAGIGVGIIVIITAIYEIISFGYEKFYLYASLVGLALIIIFTIKNYNKKNKKHAKNTKKIFSKKG